MRLIARELLCLAVAGLATWWLLFCAPAPDLAPGGAAMAAPMLTIEEAVAAGSFEVIESAPSEELSAADVEPEPEADPAAAEDAGQLDGAEEGELFEEPAGQESAAEPEDLAQAEADRAAAKRARAVQLLQRDEVLLEAAREELEGEVKRGFQTVLLSEPEDQVDIAAAFREQVVLVPRAALDPGAATQGVISYRLDLDSGRVQELPGRPELERFRQYRDLLNYEFARLPAPLRSLRKRVVRRDEIFVFAALIPAAEWALVIGRRREAVRLHGLMEADVKRFELRYRRLADGAFDLEVHRLVLADGRILPGAAPIR